MKRINLPFYDGAIDLELPESWDLSICAPKEFPTLSDDDLREAFIAPIGAKRLRELAKGKQTAAIVIEDVTRPMRVDRLVPLVLEELLTGGIKAENIIIVAATGCHKPQTGPDFRRKLGDKIVDNYRTLSPSLYEQLNYIGTTRLGTPIYLNSEVAAADIKIGVGGILPHPTAGFGGGGKTVLPGVCGFTTIANHHLKGVGSGAVLGAVEGNPFREDLEEGARLTGLDFVVNAVMGVSRDIVGLFVGDIIEAHRKGVRMAREAYKVKARGGVDLAIISAYPEDYDLIQSTKALTKGMGMDSVKKGGKVLLVTACPDGLGYHALYGPSGQGRTAFKRHQETSLIDRELIIFSLGVGPIEALDVFPEKVRIFNDPDLALEYFSIGVSPTAKVNIFPYGVISILS